MGKTTAWGRTVLSLTVILRLVSCRVHLRHLACLTLVSLSVKSEGQNQSRDGTGDDTVGECVQRAQHDTRRVVSTYWAVLGWILRCLELILRLDGVELGRPSIPLCKWQLHMLSRGWIWCLTPFLSVSSVTHCGVLTLGAYGQGVA